MLHYISKAFIGCFVFVLNVSSFANVEVVKTLPDKIEQHSKKQHTLLQKFNDNYGRVYYFVQEITNNIDDIEPVQSFDLVNPEFNQGLESFSGDIMPGILLLENVEKTVKQRGNIQDIKAFLETNYKTSYLPAKVYRENEHIDKPLYVSKLREMVFSAVATGNLYELRAILDNYELLNITSDDGYNLLSYAILHKQDMAADLLLKRGIDINSKNRYGGTPLIVAARAGNLTILKQIAHYKHCDIMHRDRFGNSAIDYAYLTNNRQMHAYLRDVMNGVF
jgi:hypothetical protein